MTKEEHDLDGSTPRKDALSLIMRSAVDQAKKEKEFIHLILNKQGEIRIMWSESQCDASACLGEHFCCKFSQSMLFEKHHEVYVNLYEEDSVEPSECIPFEGPAFRLSPSQMKSSLQKCVRLSRTQAAVRNAFYIMSRMSDVKTVNGAEFNGIIELLRRITIIMIEDSILHPELSLILWLTIACSKGFILSNIYLQMAILQVRNILSPILSRFKIINLDNSRYRVQ